MSVWKIILIVLGFFLVSTLLIWFCYFIYYIFYFRYLNKNKSTVVALLSFNGEVYGYECWVLKKVKNSENEYHAYTPDLGKIIITQYDDKFIITYFK